MRVAAQEHNGWLTFTFQPEAGEPRPGGAATMAGRSARFRLPGGVGRDEIHPDLEALAAYLIVHPFIGDQVTFDRPVSPTFRDALARSWQHGSGPTDERLAPRQRPQDGRPALAYSGGVDSTAALAVLPPSDRRGLLRACRSSFRRHGRSVSNIGGVGRVRERGGPREDRAGRADGLRACPSPVGFPTIWSNATAAILVADAVGADSMSWGIIAESGYGIGHRVFVDWAGRPVNDLWADVFAAVGLPVLQAIVGVSEVGTTRIVRASAFAEIPASCVRGAPRRACGRCAKCFRKSLLDLAVAGGSPSDAALDLLFSSKEVRKTLATFPIKHENVITYIAARYRGSHPLMNLLRRRVRGDVLDLDWLEHWYEPSAAMLPETHRTHVVETLDQILGRMSPDQEMEMRAWDMRPMLEDPSYVEIHQDLVASLGRHGVRRPSGRSVLAGSQRTWPAPSDVGSTHGDSRVPPVVDPRVVSWGWNRREMTGPTAAPPVRSASPADRVERHGRGATKPGMYVEDPRFAAPDDRVQPGSAVFLRDAIRVRAGRPAG